MLTPLEIESKNFTKKKIGGYDIDEVNLFHKEVERDYEVLYRENLELKDKINVVNDAMKYYKNIEETLQSALITAEKTSTEMRRVAEKKADVIEQEALQKADRMMSEATQRVYDLNIKIDHLLKEYENLKRRIKHLYLGQIEALEQENLSIDKLLLEEAAITNNK